MRTADAPNPKRRTSSASSAHAADCARHEECLRLYFRQAKTLWGSGTLTRRDRALLDQLRLGLHLSVTEAAALESRAARDVATPAELAEDVEPPLLRARPPPGPWLRRWHPEPKPESA